MSDPDPLPWLRRLCSASPVDRHAWSAAPRLWLAPDGATWAIATDGHLMAYLGTGTVAGLEPIPPDKVRYPAHYWLPRGPAVLTLPLAVLRRWCEPAVWEQPCPSCQGTARTSPYVICTFCDQDGVMSPDVRPGWLCGESIDRNLLAKGLSGVPDGPVAIYGENHVPLGDDPAWRRKARLRKSLGERVVWCVGADWRVVLMTMATAGTHESIAAQWPDAPRLEAAALPWPDYLIWLDAVAANPLAAGAFSDWLEEQGPGWEREAARLRRGASKGQGVTEEWS